MFENISFANPQFFWLLLLLPVAMLWYFFKRREQTASLKMSSIKGFPKGSILPKLKPALFVMRLLALAAIIVAMARPQTEDISTRTKTTKGIDIVMAIDVSSSMLAKDLKPYRLSALKKVAADFINERPNDRIGLVAYAGESYTKTPITSDKSIVLRALDEITYGQLNDGTAIGMGLATSVNRLKESKALSKVIILLTDGVNNSGFIEPQTAADLAVEFGIKTYTIGIGTNGNAMTPIAYNADGSFRYGMREVEIDESLLKSIAETTGGQYFRATDNEKLEAIYEEINKLEKTEVEEFKYYKYEERFRPWVYLAGVLLLLEWLARNTLFRSFI
ncbi:vWA domain-containing protein [Arenibacter algicola]|jgi:Ca-activated chloride channel family protein|uniref:von Willebrand factor type A domain protein n=1 Tax=Arenibacter algicola TaxID=616991 RepID=A0A221UUD8_9FLAO|nr:VWA domain-containing protein [Arenibacter algicola]ASO04521.1 von Willebrand factor type A domain protein [Arenibacter algicola]MDX1758186.1 VWA domain-containing protein [Arenibacter algicola]|tara:strand:- start:65218 stop:66216 length:999 start_codon:yes stop_codon:yes gene_type:complete